MLAQAHRHAGINKRVKPTFYLTINNNSILFMSHTENLHFASN